ncbi:Cof-type HAD-IIB family hydrolase [Amphibacillus sp. Q70]|uniref:Cof-type HAD-IIB family hydrolase n=1 Tax=Amphibacillus sp. Q70 TaxID=3453416 RepID=UPI003F87CDC3
MYELIAFDMDGTLLNDNKEMTLEVQNALKRAKQMNFKLVLSSGRSYAGLRKYLNVLGQDLIDYAICFNGSMIKEIKTNNTFHQLFLMKDDIQYIYNLSEKIGLNVHFVAEEEIYTPNNPVGKYTVYESFLTDTKLIYRDIRSIHDEGLISKAVISGEVKELEDKIKNIPSDLHRQFNAVKSDTTFYDILNKQASKGNALKRLAESLQINRSNIVSFGDHENDISMIEYSGLGISMENALDNVKSISDHITSSNNDNGIVKALEEVVFK